MSREIALGALLWIKISDNRIKIIVIIAITNRQAVPCSFSVSLNS